MAARWFPPFVPTPPAGDSSGRVANTQFLAGRLVTDFVSGIIKSPANQDYRLVEKLPFAVTVTEFSAKTSTGTITATLKINATAITGGALNASSTQTTVAPSALNTAAIASTLVLTGSAATSPADLSFIVVFTRTT